ncbi:DUF4349 domain-containing protein, partial [Rodentibacter caecimuris]|uniref:DUF4349 domain-containing protein n=1 Tax=Rodentibacter caecimuris TaxID=1796644 RepID=UPI00361BAAF2
PAAEKAAEPGTADRGGPAAADTAAKAPNLQVDQRSIIYTGSITLRVKDVNQDAARVLAIASGAGGFVGSDKRSSGDTTDAAEATIELRVPADKFQSVVDQIAGLGEVKIIASSGLDEQAIEGLLSAGVPVDEGLHHGQLRAGRGRHPVAVLALADRVRHAFVSRRPSGLRKTIRKAQL